MRSIDDLETVAKLAVAEPALYVRVSKGPDDDRLTGSTDFETGLTLPGLSVNPLHPPSWWHDRPVVEWVSRQLCAYEHLVDDERSPWLLIGEIVGRGPDNEPLVELVESIAWLAPTVMAEAHHRRQGSPRPEDGAAGEKPPWQS